MALFDAWPLGLAVVGPEGVYVGVPGALATLKQYKKVEGRFVAPEVRAALGVASKLVSKMLPSACLLLTCAFANVRKQPRCQYGMRTHVVLVHNERTCVDMLVCMMCSLMRVCMRG